MLYQSEYTILFLLLTHNTITYIWDSWEGKDGSDDWETPERVDGHGEEAAKESDEAVDLNDHPHDWPSQQHH